jgi:L-threonylcarbamoyladenylate synthase
MLRLKVDPAAPQEDVLARAAEAVRGGSIAAIPTDTLYGLAADARHPQAVERIFAIKGRGEGQPLPLIAASRRQVEEAFGPLSPVASRLADRFWPGPLTLLLPSAARLAPGVAGTGRVAVRVPDHAVARALCAACGSLVTATSANRSGQPPSNDPDAVSGALGGAIDVLLDAGLTTGGPPSTIVDVTGDRPALVRAGAIRWEAILACLEGG